MEPTARSQKNYTLQIINQQEYRNAVSAKMSLANARLFAGAEFVENNISTMCVDGRINSRPSQPGQISKILVDGYWCVVNFVVVSFPEDVGDNWIHFLLNAGDDGTFEVAKNSHAIVSENGSFDTGDVGDFFEH
jgi:hypothetical protein